MGGFGPPRLGCSDGSTNIGHAAALGEEKIGVTLPKVPQKGAPPGSKGAQQGELLTLKPNDGFGGGKGKGKLSGNSSGLDQERFWLGILSPIVENQVGMGQSSQPPSGHLLQEFLDTPNSAFSSHAETFAGGTCTWGPLGEPPKHLHQGLLGDTGSRGWLDWVIWEVFSIFSEFIPCSVGATRPWKGGGSAGAHGEASPGCRAFCWPREGQFGFLFRGITQS